MLVNMLSGCANIAEGNKIWRQDIYLVAKYLSSE